MAGSYEHVKSGLSMIENMGDATEAIEELYYLVRALGNDRDIQEALKEFYRFKRGERDPARLFATHLGLFQTDFGKAYTETQEVMGK